MKRLDEVSKPPEYPFPQNFSYIFDLNLGKNIEVPIQMIDYFNSVLKVQTIDNKTMYWE
ncbi:hypothetical protein C1645_829473 [Glomus cerebriforme]|uniref:Uncharacterized protein n=1 Tax=Glomus cerebriforme TaxID=658196 RepID=A0A397SJA6_9GLOM|nr:hypothetical protein C1645_829473 [Glomus cerebriforme]